VLKTTSRVVSTLGSSLIGYSAMSSFADGDPLLLGLGIGTGALIGGSVVFVWIPQSLKNNLIDIALIIGSVMAFTWTFNTSYLLDRKFNIECNKIDGQYENLKREYINLKSVSKYDTDKLKELNTTVSKLEIRYNQLSSDLNPSTSPLYKDISDEVDIFLKTEKGKGLERWRGKNGYKKLAKDYYCNTSSSGGISYARLKSCIINYRFKEATKSKKDEFDTISKELNEKRGLLNMEISNYRKYLADSKANESLKLSKKAKIDKIEKKAHEKTDAIEIYLKVLMFVIGFFIEVVAIMWEELLKKIKTKREKKAILGEKKEKIEKEVEKKEEELSAIEEVLQEAKKEYKAVIHNEDAMRYIIALAKGEDYQDAQLFSILLREKFKKGRGKTLALANSIVGAFLYALTIKKEGVSVQSWDEVIPANILFVNGYGGKEVVKGRERRLLLEQYEAFNGEIVPCLGSTASTLNNKAIREYKKANGLKIEPISPQDEALSYLRYLEKLSDKYAPQKIKVEDMKAVIQNFVKKYYPNQF
jgi:hypothetical protein